MRFRLTKLQIKQQFIQNQLSIKNLIIHPQIITIKIPIQQTKVRDKKSHI